MKNETNKLKTNVEKIVAIIFIAMIFSAFIFTIIESNTEIKTEIKNILDDKEKTGYEKISELSGRSETILNDNIHMKSTYVNIYGLIQRIMNKNYVQDSNDRTRDIVKLQNNMLTFIQKKENMEIKAENISNLNQILEEANIPFIYIQAPYKIKDENDLPIGVIDYANENADSLLANLEKFKVNTVDLREYLSNMSTEEKYFITDHHWKIETAFKASNYISEILNENYDFKIDDFFKDINNYKKVKQEKYLGSIGKRIGKYYAGIDNFEYILPNYETKMKINKNNLDTALAKNCMTLKELSTKSKVATAVLYKIGKDNSNLRTVTVGKIAKALNCDVTELLETEK